MNTKCLIYKCLLTWYQSDFYFLWFDLNRIKSRTSIRKFFVLWTNIDHFSTSNMQTCCKYTNEPKCNLLEKMIMRLKKCIIWMNLSTVIWFLKRRVFGIRMKQIRSCYVHWYCLTLCCHFINKYIIASIILFWTHFFTSFLI